MKISKARVKQSEVSRNLTNVTTQHGYAINDHFSDTSVTPAQLVTAIIVAAVLLFVTFFLHPVSFWLDILVTVAVLVFLALAWSDIKISRAEINIRSLFVGLVGGAILYLFCLGGNFVLEIIWPHMHDYVGELYDLAYSVPLWLVLILLLVLVPGEEIFWRGFVQRTLKAYFGSNIGIVLAVAIYTLVHIWALNPLLILAAAVGGTFWGVLYNWQNNLFVPILAHLTWCVLILAVYPLG